MIAARRMTVAEVMATFSWVLVLFFLPPILAQDASATTSVEGEAGSITPWQSVATAYEPSPAFPYGRPHPDAPAELAQFEFFIGAFDCIDTLRQPDGSKIEFPAIWNARYFLNGHAIQDHYWSPTFSTSNVRIYDSQDKAWKVTFFRMPGYQSGVWTGKQIGDTIQLRAQGKTDGPALTFHNIRPDGFDWHSGGENPGWMSRCTRR